QRFPGHAEFIGRLFAEIAASPGAGSSPEHRRTERPASLAEIGRTEEGHPSCDPVDPQAARAIGATSSPGQRFRIVRQHARGGLGTVFFARDEELGRDVALKEIQLGSAHDPNSRARFIGEAKITGRLEHPGIVPVYGLGAYEDGRPYYAMRLIRGVSLKEAIDQHHRAERPEVRPGELP